VSVYINQDWKTSVNDESEHRCNIIHVQISKSTVIFYYIEIEIVGSNQKLVSGVSVHWRKLRTFFRGMEILWFLC